jgi:ankyrin repeat protein
MKGEVDVAMILVNAGADLNARDRDGATPMDKAVRADHAKVVAMLLAKGAQRPALHEAILHSQAELVRVLLDGGVDPNRLGPEGSTPLNDACLKGERDIVSLLIAHGAKVGIRNESGATPLHDAALGGNPEVVKILLDHGADINARDEESGASPLFYAASWGRVEAVELLLRRGADLGLPNRKGQSPLDAARENDHKDVADLLRRHMPQVVHK